MTPNPGWFRVGVYTNGLVLGFVLMGFEMLGSRYLNPYFGSGITTWAALISTVLGALMTGYFLGGNLVDRRPRADLLGWLVLAAAIYLLGVPYFADPMILLLMDIFGDGQAGVIFASIFLLFVPVALLGTFSPFGVRLLLEVTASSGRISGQVYGISTVGNILGTLGVVLVFIPNFGTRMITTIFAVIVIVCSISLLAMDRYLHTRR